MSIKRYAMSWGTDEDEFVYVSPTESTNGNWVKYEDYARLQQERVHDLNQIGGLQQELARLRASSFVTAVPVEQYERVVMAGDEMLDHIQTGWVSEYRAIEGWKSAKEGKPSA